MIRSVQTGKCEMLICEICLAEIYRKFDAFDIALGNYYILISRLVLSKQLLTPLMLKKNPELVRAVSKLCRFANSNIRQPGEACSKIRSYANKTFSSFKVGFTPLIFSQLHRYQLFWFSMHIFSVPVDDDGLRECYQRRIFAMVQ